MKIESDLPVKPMMRSGVGSACEATKPDFWPGSEQNATPADKADAPWGFTPFWLFVLLLSIPLVATLFWWLGREFFDSSLTLIEYFQFSVVVAGIVAGGYQMYFWAQRNNLHRPARCMKIGLDDYIPFWPSWIWFYSLLYFVMIGLTVVSIRDLAHGVELAFGGLMLVTIGSVIFYLFPTDVPESFRRFEVTNLSTRYLAFIQSMDNSRNAFPSMHCAIATYIGLAVSGLPDVGVWIGIGHIVTIAISCVVVKQHVLLDTIAGVLLGAAVYYLNIWLALF